MMSNSNMLIEESEPADVLIRTNHCPKCTSKKLQIQPPDGGWGWVVVGAAFYVAITLAAIAMSFGIIFSDPLTKMGVSSTVTALILNSHSFLWHISSILGGPLCENFGWRPVAFVGYAITSVAFMSLIYANSPLLIFFLFSVIIGIAGGISASVVYLIVPAYFDKLKGRAMAIIMAGQGLNMVIVPPLIRTLINEYSFQGCALIFGGILANCCVASMFFHPLEWHQPTVKEVEKSYRKISKCTQDFPIDTGNKRGRSKTREVLYSTLRHLKQIKQTRLVIVTISFSLFVISNLNFAGQIPFALQEKGYDKNLASLCISASAISSTVFRIIVSFISDKSWFSRKICYMTGFIISGLSIIVLSLVMDNLVLIFTCMAVWGVGTALVLSTFHALMMDTCGRDLYVSGVCIKGFFFGTLSIIIGPFFGLIRDNSSFVWSMGSCGIIQLLCTAIWVFMPCAIKSDLKIKEDESRTRHEYPN